MGTTNDLLAGHNSGAPPDDFDGLNTAQVEVLLGAPLSPACVIRFNKDCGDEELGEVPLLGLSELLLEEIRRSGELKLTARGNLPVAVCRMLCDRGMITWEYREYLSRVTENGVPFIWPLKLYLLSEGLVKKRYNALSLTRKGTQFVRGDKKDRFLHLLTFFTTRFNWMNWYAYNDGGVCGQLGWAYSLYLIKKYGGETRDGKFYSGKWIQAFDPELWEDYHDEHYKGIVQIAHQTYEIRLLEYFANWFGFIDIERNPFRLSYREPYLIRKSALLDVLFVCP